MKIKNEKQAMLTGLIVCCLSIIIFEAISLRGVTSITNNSSEFNVIAVAAGISGYDWTDTILKNYYYGFTSSVLFSLVFRIPGITSHPLFLFRLLLSMNVLIILICSVCLFFILKNIITQNGWQVDYVFISLVTVTCSFFLSTQVLTRAVTNENVLVACYYLALLVITHSIPKNNIISSILLAFLGIIAYATNGRGIILIGIICFLLALSFILKKELFCNPIVYALATIIMYVGFKFTKRYFVRTYFYTEGGVLKNNDVSGMLSRLIQTFSPEGLKILFDIITGWGFYYIVSTFGIGIIIISAAITIIVKYIKKNDDTFCSGIFYLAAFTVLFIIASVMLGSVFYHDSFYAMNFNSTDTLAGNRVDKLVYGRYISTIKPISVALAFVFLKYYRNFSRKHCFAFLVIFSISIVLFIWNIYPMMRGNRFAAVDIPEIALFLGNMVKDYKFGFVNTDNGAFAMILFYFNACAAFLFLHRKKTSHAIALVLALNLSLNIWMDQALIYPRSEYFRSLVDEDFLEYCREYDYESNAEKIVIANKAGYLYQFWLPDFHVLPEDSIDELELEDYKAKYPCLSTFDMTS